MGWGGSRGKDLNHDKTNTEAFKREPEGSGPEAAGQLLRNENLISLKKKRLQQVAEVKGHQGQLDKVINRTVNLLQLHQRL